MDIVEKCLPSFLKVLCCDFRAKLQIPPESVKEFEEEMLSKKVVLKTNHPGEMWLVKMEKVENDYFFGKGWKQFAMDHNLEKGDSLVFKLLDKSTFEVLLYDTSGCQKKFMRPAPALAEIITKSTGHKSKKPRVSVERSRPRLKVEPDSEEEDDEIQIAPSSKTEHLHFVAILNKKYKMHFLYVPVDFARSTKIAGKNSVILKDPKGREWPVILSEKGRFTLTSGWSEFVRGNKIAQGDECEFHYNHGNVIKVDFVRKEAVGRAAN